MIRYWFKILTCTDTKYVKLIYKMMLNDLNLRPNKPNWAFYVKHLLESLGFINVWLNQGVGNINRFISSPEPKAQGELIVWDSSRRPSVRASVRPHFQT